MLCFSTFLALQNGEKSEKKKNYNSHNELLVVLILRYVLCSNAYDNPSPGDCLTNQFNQVFTKVGQYVSEDYKDEFEVRLACDATVDDEVLVCKGWTKAKCVTCTEIVAHLINKECTDGVYMRSKFLDTSKIPNTQTQYRVHEKHCKDQKKCTNFKQIANSVEYKDGNYIYTEKYKKKGKKYGKGSDVYT